MKKFKYGLSVLVFAFLYNIGYAQKNDIIKSTKLYDELIAKKQSYNPLVLDLVKRNTKQPTLDYSSSVRYAEFYQIENSRNIKSIADAPYTIEIDVSFQGKTYSCVFQRNYLKSQNYKLTTAKKITPKKLEAIFYRGIVEGQTTSWATLSYIDGFYKILIAHQKGNIEVNHIENGTYAIYDSKDQVIIPEFICAYVDKAVKDENASTSRIGSDCLELYIECDFQSYLDNSSSVANKRHGRCL